MSRSLDDRLMGNFGDLSPEEMEDAEAYFKHIEKSIRESIEKMILIDAPLYYNDEGIQRLQKTALQVFKENEETVILLEKLFNERFVTFTIGLTRRKRPSRGWARHVRREKARGQR